MTREQIIDAAEELARREGMSSVSVRRVSAALSVTPGALYWHLESMGALIAEIVDRANERVEPPDGTGPWLERLLAFYGSTRDVFIEYPGISAALMTAPTSDAVLANCLHVVRLLIDGGFGQKAAVRLFNALSTYLTGHLMMIDAVRIQHGGDPDAVAENVARLRSLVATRPELRTFDRALIEYDEERSRAEFLHGIEFLARGAAATSGVPVPEGRA